MVHVIIKKTPAEIRRETQRNFVESKRMEDREVNLINSKKRSKNAGFSEPGFNMGLGTFIRNKDHYKREVMKRKADDPNFHEV